MRSLRRGAIAAGIVAGSLLAACGSDGAVDVSSSGGAADVKAAAPTSSNAVDICSDASFVGPDGSPTDWEKAADRFDEAGPFQLPSKPDWAPVEAYCAAILVALSPSPPSPDGTKSVDPGANRFALGAEATTLDELAYGNAVMIAMYPSSIHTTYDASGARERGFLAPGLGMVSASEFSTSDEVVSSPVVQDAIADIVRSCAAGACDTMTKAAVEADQDIVGQHVTP